MEILYDETRKKGWHSKHAIPGMAVRLARLSEESWIHPRLLLPLLLLVTVRCERRCSEHCHIPYSL